MSRGPVGLVLLALAVACLGSGHALARDLTFEERVAAQEAIERVYYSHQIGTTKPFEEAVPREVLEEKVRNYLKLSVALERFWSTPVSAPMLQAEVGRIERGTQMPQRVQEIYTALNGDAFLIQECLAREILVGRLARNFFALDSRIHAVAHTEALSLRERLQSRELDPSSPEPHRTVVELELSGSLGTPTARTSEAPSAPHSPPGRIHLRLDADAFRESLDESPQDIGEIGPITNRPDAFTISVVLRRERNSAEIATYSVSKIPWETWWREHESDLDTSLAASVASESDSGRRPPRLESAAPRCQMGDSWDDRVLDNLPRNRTGHTAVWTGSLMLVWGGWDQPRGSTGLTPTAGGERYDPATDSWTRISRVNAPTNYVNHTAVWTGRVMVIWGGGSNKGGRYDPATDTWEPISNVNAPAARGQHSAVWTGSSMIVWGGLGGSGLLDSGGRYDPVTDTWASISRVGAPSGRVRHTAIWTGSLMVIWGGTTDPYSYFSGTATGGRYDPIYDRWTDIWPLWSQPHALGFHTAVWTGSEMVVWGTGTDYLADGGRYDPVLNLWSPISRLNAPSQGAYQTAIWTGESMILWGGIYFGYPPQIATGPRYDPATDTWSQITQENAPWNRSGHSAIWTGSLMIIHGGSSSVGNPVANSGGRYDPRTDSWTPTSTMNAPFARSGHRAVWTGNMMLIWGGRNQSFELPDTGARYDPILDAWRPMSATNAPPVFTYDSAVWTGSDFIVWGGWDGQQYRNSGAKYDPVRDEWTPTSTVNVPSPRGGHSAVWTGREMLIWGGADTLAATNTGGKYNPVHDTWESISGIGSPSPRSGHIAFWTGHLMVVWGGGGYNAVTPLGTGGRYDPSSNEWMPMTESDAFIGKRGYSAVWTGRWMVIWGGQGDIANTQIRTGWRYDPAQDLWTPTANLNAPPARAEHTAVWTGAEMIVYGGYSNYENIVNTGGRYNPVSDTWVATTLVNAPPLRTGHSAIWADRSMIVWGGWMWIGLGSFNSYLTETNGGESYSLGCQPPLAHIEPSDRVECSSASGGIAVLDGSASIDSDSTLGTNDDINTFDWFEDYGLETQRPMGTGMRISEMLPLGNHRITLKAVDAEGLVGFDTTNLMVVDSTPPEILCPQQSGVECASPQGSLVALAVGATDACSPDPIVRNDRTVSGGDASGIYPLGSTSVTFTATDAGGNTSVCSTDILVRDTLPPQISIGVQPAILWPPNHRMVDLSASAIVTDACSTPSVLLSSILSNDPDDSPANGDGSTTGDVQGVDLGTTDSSFQLRAERDGNGPGRTYTVTYTAVDGSGNSSQAHAFVVVPHDMGGSTEPLELSVQEALTGTRLSWNPVDGATAYKVIRGNVRSLQFAGDFIDLGTVSCIRSGSSQTSTSGQEDGKIPAPGEAFFYLASYNDGRESGFGSASAAKPRISTAGGCE